VLNRETGINEDTAELTMRFAVILQTKFSRFESPEYRIGENCNSSKNMNHFFDCLVEDYKPVKASTLTATANKLIGRRKTRRGTKKKPTKSAKYLRELQEAKKQQAQLKRAYAIQFQDFKRAMAKD